MKKKSRPLCEKPRSGIFCGPIFIINGEEFHVESGCMAWIQATQVLTICPDFGDPLRLWVCAYDYQLTST